MRAAFGNRSAILKLLEHSDERHTQMANRYRRIPPPSTPPGSQYRAADGKLYTVAEDGYIIIDGNGTEICPDDMKAVPRGTAAFNAKYAGVFPDHIVDQVLAAS